MKKLLALLMSVFIAIGCSTDKDEILNAYPQGSDPRVYKEFNISEDYAYSINEEYDLIQFYKFTEDLICIKLFKYSDKKHLINVSDNIQTHNVDLGFGEHITLKPNRVFPAGYVKNKSTSCYLFVLADAAQRYRHTYVKMYFENITNGEIRKESLFYPVTGPYKIKAIDNGFLLGHEDFSRIYNIDGSLYLEDHSGLNLFEAYSLSKDLYIHLDEINNKDNVIYVWRYNASTQEKINLDVFDWDPSKLKIKKISNKIEDGILYVYLETVSLEGVDKNLTFNIDIQTMQIL